MIYVKCCKFIALNLHKIHVAVYISFGLPVDACKWTFGLAPRPPSDLLCVPRVMGFGVPCTPKPKDPWHGLFSLRIVHIEQLCQTMCDGAAD